MLATIQSTSAPPASYGHSAAPGQFYSIFWRLPDPAGRKPQFLRSPSFSTCFWSKFQLAEQKRWVTGNCSSRRWQSSKYDAGPTVQDRTFEKSSLLKLIKRQVESSCYSEVLSMHNVPTTI